MMDTYVIVTPARNEAEYIALTLESMVAQTVRPARWVIVSDGSTDGTDEIVQRYVDAHDWIRLVRLPERRERTFAGKVHAFNAGLAQLDGVKYDAIACLDGDVSFEPDFFEFLLGRLRDDDTLGLVTTCYCGPLKDMRDYHYASLSQATGPCQLFRASSFEAIGGYVPVKTGSVDRIADIACRMHGWTTRTFAERVYVHHRPTGTAQQGVLKARFKDGAKDYAVGGSMLWQAFRSVYQMRTKPVVIGGAMLWLGFMWSWVRRVPRPVSPEMAEFYKREQLERLRGVVKDKFLRRAAPAASQPAEPKAVR